MAEFGHYAQYPIMCTSDMETDLLSCEMVGSGIAGYNGQLLPLHASRKRQSEQLLHPRNLTDGHGSWSAIALTVTAKTKHVRRQSAHVGQRD